MEHFRSVIMPSFCLSRLRPFLRFSVVNMISLRRTAPHEYKYDFHIKLHAYKSVTFFLIWAGGVNKLVSNRDYLAAMLGRSYFVPLYGPRKAFNFLHSFSELRYNSRLYSSRFHSLSRFHRLCYSVEFCLGVFFVVFLVVFFLGGGYFFHLP